MSKSTLRPVSSFRRSARISARLSARFSPYPVNPTPNLSATSSTPPTRTNYLMNMDDRMEKWTAELLAERLENVNEEKSTVTKPNENNVPPPPHNTPVVQPVVAETSSPAHSGPSSATLVEEIPISYLPETRHYQNSGDDPAPKSVSKLEKQLRNARAQIENIESAFKDATQQLRELSRVNKELEQQIRELKKTENEYKSKKQLILQILKD